MVSKEHMILRLESLIKNDLSATANHNYREGIEAAIGIIKSEPDIDNWISLDDFEPEPETRVIVQLEDDTVLTTYFGDVFELPMHVNPRANKVKFWMPYPRAKGESDDI